VNGTPNQGVDQLLKKGKRSEDEYEFLGAVDHYENALRVYLDNALFQEAIGVHERIGYCHYRAAYQSETNAEFKDQMEHASQAFHYVENLYDKTEVPEKEALILSSNAMARYLESWRSEQTSVRVQELDTCIETNKRALSLLEESDDGGNYGKVCNDFLTHLYARFELSFEWEECKDIIEESLAYGSKAIEALESMDNDQELAMTYCLLSHFLPDRPMDVYESIDKQNELHQQGRDFAKKAVELSKKIDDKYLLGMSNGILSYYIMELDEDFETAIDLAQSQLEIGKKLSDKLMIARANDYLSYYVGYRTYLMEDPEVTKNESYDAIQYAEEAIAHYRIINTPLVVAFIPHNEGFHNLAYIETDLEKKRSFEMKGIEASLDDLEYAGQFCSLLGNMYILTQLSSSYRCLGVLERDPVKKKERLLESLQYRDMAIKLSKKAQPFRYWNLCSSHVESAETKRNLAMIENDRKNKLDLLLEAISEMEQGFDLYDVHNRVYNLPGNDQQMALVHSKFGETLVQTYILSDDIKYLERAVDCYRRALEINEKNELPRSVAEIHWKVARLHYQTHNYLLSEEEFVNASNNYRSVAEKYPSHSDFYSDYSIYMEAWSNISKAMHYHSREQYLPERDNFIQTVSLFESSERWKYLSTNFLAWAKLAEAEDLSRNENTEEARALFVETSGLFTHARKSIEDRYASIGNTDEAEMASELISASSLRRDYCLGRAAIEEAKTLNLKGEQAASAERYRVATQTFQRIVDAMENEAERREIRPLIVLCEAWDKMSQAEAQASPDLYNEASSLFEKAREYSLNDKTRLLTMGHASFCRALEAGTRYEVTRDGAMHQELVRHLSSATNFYVRAGFDTATNYSKGIQRLFEAYVYMYDASGEVAPRKRAKLYTMAETLLESSADSFSAARYPEKRDEVARLLSSVKQERKLALSLSEILDTPAISSSTRSFDVPSPSHEQPVGLERFESADVQSKIFMTSDVVTSGEEFSFELELFNSSNVSASLVRVEGLLPDDFEVSKVSGYYKMEEEYLDLKGKRIGPLGTVEITLMAKPTSRGEYTLSPSVIYLDDSGEYRTSTPEPTSITVREMGILNWLRGSNRPN
jgi:hypothetical protein